MLGLFRRRRGAPKTRAAARFVVESLEARKLLDGVIYDSSIPDPSQDPNGYYGVSTSAGPFNVNRAQSFTMGNSNLPPHSHVSMSMSFSLSIQIDPNTGQSVSDGTNDNGYLYLTFNGQNVAHWNLNDGTMSLDNPTAQVYGELSGLTATVMDDSSSAGWEVFVTSSVVWMDTTYAGAEAGTYAGFANPVEVDRGGQDGSIELSLDGPTEGTNVFFTMPCSGVINIGNRTPDNQLPDASDGQQPYFSITGPSGIQLYQSDPGEGFDIYELPMPDGAQTATINLHAVSPYRSLDYANGISVTIDSIQEDASIPILGGWFDAANNIVWNVEAGPPVNGLFLDDHVNGELSEDALNSDLASLNSTDPTVRSNAMSALVNAKRSAWFIDSITAAYIAGSPSPNMQIQLQNMMQQINPLGLLNFPNNGSNTAPAVVSTTPVYWKDGSEGLPTIDANHRYFEIVNSPDNLSPYFPSSNGPVNSMSVPPNADIPDFIVDPLHKGVGTVNVILQMEVYVPGGPGGVAGTWQDDGTESETILYTSNNQPPTLPQ